MEIKKVIELLKRSLEELQTNPKIKEVEGGIFLTWKWKVRAILVNGLGVNARLPVSQWDTATAGLPMPDSIIDPGYQRGMFGRRFEKAMPNVEATLLSIIWQLETFGLPYVPNNPETSKPKAFIAHGPKNNALNKLKEFLRALGVTPLVIEDEPSEGRSIDQQIDYYLGEADVAVIFGTADDTELKDGKLYPRRNVCIEIGRFQERFPNRIVYLLEEGASLPTNVNDNVYARFSNENMEAAFQKIALELNAFGLLIPTQIDKEQLS